MNTEIKNNSLINKRNEKGKSLLELKDDYTIIDIETTGLDSYYNEIIELGAIKIRNNKIVDRFQTLIKPTEKIDEFIEYLTNITNEMVKDAPKIEDKLKEYIDFIGTDVIIGHNVNFDINFLYDKCLEIYNQPLLKNNYIDTLRIGRRCIKETKNHKLATLAEKFKIDNENEHRALADCIITYKLFNIEKELVQKEPECMIHIKHKLKSKDITSRTNDFDIDNPLFQKECVFTGTLDRMSRKEAMQIVADFGGMNGDRVTKTTNYLVLGNIEYSTNVKGTKTNKMKDAEKKKLKGQDIEIISENVFYDMISDYIK